MRLLNAKTLRFRELVGNDIPEYAILSHCWEQDELTYRDMCRAIRQGKVKPGMRHIKGQRGFHKVYDFSVQALKDGYAYIWVDTCCIDKSSSAELQEAINSMFQWYENSKACYVYLSDVSMAGRCGSPPCGDLSAAGWIKSFKASRWFTRGWTLQELLAPWNLVFFDRSWKKCASVDDLHEAIYAVTGIDMRAEVRDMGRDSPRFWPLRVARRMSWAANRQTTRIEDRAYSLLGLFDVNMPLLYGEGERAFQRLQEEIIKVEEDASILAWSHTDADMAFSPNGLARSPSHFYKYLGLVARARSPFVSFNPTITPRGLCATLKIRRDPNADVLAYAVLMNEEGRYSRRLKSLVLPILFPRLTFLRSDVENECIRFSDPLWVSSTFVQKAQPASVCFIRQVQAADVNHNSDGFSLCSTVWENYVTTFTYPIQTQPGRRHFPAIFGGLSESSGWKPGGRTFIVELEARVPTAQRFVVLVDYQVEEGRILEGPAVTIIRLQKAINLAHAANLAEMRKARHNFTQCNLFDCSGRVIPTDEIVCVNNFHSYWVHAGDDDFDEVPVRKANAPAVKILGYMEKNDVQLRQVAERP